MSVVLLATGCGAVIGGAPTPDGFTGGYQLLGIPDEPAVWAMRAIDPCLLLDSPQLDDIAFGGTYLTKPHSCARDIRLPNGVRDHVEVNIGTRFVTADRARTLPVRLGGVSAHQEYEPVDEKWFGRLPHCTVHIPISGRRSIDVEAAALARDIPTGCAIARAAAEGAAVKLSVVTQLVGTAPPTALRRWRACDLLEAAIGLPAQQQSVEYDDADACSTGSESSGISSTPEVDVRTEAGMDPTLEPDDYRVRKVTLTFGRAELFKGEGDCQVTFAAEPITDAPPERSAQRMVLRVKGGPDSCGAAVDSAERIHRTLQTMPPQLSPPSKLGFRDGEPDDTVPAACGVISNSTAGDCRLPRPAQVPHGRSEVIESVSNPDVVCVMLRDATIPVLGRDVEYAAWRGNGCFALTLDGFSVTFEFQPDERAEEYCVGPGLHREPARVGDRSGWECESNGHERALYLPAFGGDAREPGTLMIDGELRVPRGVESFDRPDDRARVTALTDRIAAHVITTYLS